MYEKPDRFPELSTPQKPGLQSLQLVHCILARAHRAHYHTQLILGQRYAFTFVHLLQLSVALNTDDTETNSGYFGFRFIHFCCAEVNIFMKEHVRISSETKMS